MEMNQFQAIFHFFLFDEIERFQQFTGSQSELAGIASAFFPFSTSRRGKFDADTDVGTHVQLLGNPGNQLQFVQLLDYQENPLTHFLGQQGQFDVTLVLVSVTYNQRIRIRINSDDCMQFRF